MKNKMHACLVAFLAVTTVATTTMGSMQYVFASEKTSTKTTTGRSVKTAEIDICIGEGDNDIDCRGGNSIDIEIGESSKKSSSEKTDLSGEVAGIAYSKLAMANVDVAVNVREKATEDSEILGKLYTECAGEILEKGSEWTKIKTGKLSGWVRNDYLLFGADAKKLADSVVEKVAVSMTSCLRVRKDPSQDASVLDLLAEGDEIKVVKELGDWVSVEFADGTIGYVSSEYVNVTDEIGKGETMESINAREEALRKEKEAAAKQQKKESKSSGSSGSSKASSGSSTGSASAAGYDDVTLLAALIQSEAGNESFEGQVSVGAVVMNRLRSGRYGSSLYSVIYAKGQFSPAGSGKVAEICAKGPKSSCIQAASAALAGSSYVGGATKFRPVSSGHEGVVVGNHVFW